MGGLGNTGDKQELWRTFSKYGTLREVWVARNPPGFAFVEFEDSRDANEAVRAMDGRRLGDRKLRVEISKTRNRGGDRGGRRGGREGGYRDSSRRYDKRDDFRHEGYGGRSSGDPRFSRQPRQRYFSSILNYGLCKQIHIIEFQKISHPSPSQKVNSNSKGEG